MNRWQASAAVLALCVGVSGGAWAQQWPHQDNRDYQRGRYGWQNNQRDHDGDRDDGYRNGRGGNQSYARNQGYRIGYQDGLNDGRRDFDSRHKFQPEKAGNYKHADRGYNSSFGDKNSYKQVYRNGYLQGYRAGYGNRGYGQGTWQNGQPGRRY